MRVHASLLCAVLLISGSLFAQQLTPAPAAQPDQDHPWLNHPKTFPLNPKTFLLKTQSTTLFVWPSGATCPVDIRARHATDGGLVKVRNHEQAPAARHGQGIHLALGHSSTGKHVTQATVTARGYSQRSRILDARNGGDAPDLHRTLEVQFAPEGEGSVSAEFFLPGFSSVTTVRLDSITYDDGSTWKPENASMCRVQPDGFMLVAAD